MILSDEILNKKYGIGMYKNLPFRTILKNTNYMSFMVNQEYFNSLYPSLVNIFRLALAGKIENIQITPKTTSEMDIAEYMSYLENNIEKAKEEGLDEVISARSDEKFENETRYDF